MSDDLLDGSTLPWDFVSGPHPEGPSSRPVPAARRTPEQVDRRRLIAAGRWRR